MSAGDKISNAAAEDAKGKNQRGCWSKATGTSQTRGRGCADQVKADLKRPAKAKGRPSH
jgi:uncharacterized protein YjbJ (UPF0337 family)